MNKNIQKIALLGIVLSLSNCTTTKKNQNDAVVTNTYSLQTCDRESQAYFVEMEHKGTSYTGFISTDNPHKIPETKQKFKIGTSVPVKNLSSHFDGIYRTYE